MKKVGKVLALGILGLFLISFLMGAVSAAEGLTDLAQGFVEGVVSIINPFLQVALGDNDPTNIYVGKLFMLIILASIVYVTLSKSMASFFTDNKWALWVISIGVPLLGIHFLDSSWVWTAILPSSVYAVTVAAGLPFVLFFFMVSSWDSPTLRRTAWILFGVVFLLMYSSLSGDRITGAAAGVYPLAAILAFMMAALDGTINRFRKKLAFEKNLTGQKYNQYVMLMDHRDKLVERLMKEAPGSVNYIGLETQISVIDAKLKKIGFK